MRTVLIAFAIGVCVVVLRASRGKIRLSIAAVLLLVLAFGAFVVSRTRAKDALALQDSSVNVRLAVAKAGASRVLLHPIFGHGMDAVHRHWNEWGFPGDQMIGLHSTPLQLAFDRGLPALLCWVWIVGTFWLIAGRSERKLRGSSDTNSYGILLGTTGAIAAFFASSLVNYNFGDAEVALVFWWLMGVTVVLAEHGAGDTGGRSRRRDHEAVGSCVELMKTRQKNLIAVGAHLYRIQSSKQRHSLRPRSRSELTLRVLQGSHNGRVKCLSKTQQTSRKKRRTRSRRD